MSFVKKPNKKFGKPPNGILQIVTASA